MARKILISLILLSALSLLIALPQPFYFIFGLFQVFLLPGLVFLYFLMGRKLHGLDQLFYSILISPILLTVTVLIVYLGTGDTGPAATISVVLYHILFMAALLTGRGAPAEEKRDCIPWQVLALSFLFALLILLPFVINRFTLIRSDSWYHASVIKEIMNRGIPPREPCLADFPIKYMWFYHLFQVIWIRFSGLSLFQAMGFFNIINAFAFPYLIARYASFLTGKRYLIIFATLFAMAGLESVSWIFFPLAFLRALTGEVTGAAEVQRVISNLTLNGTAVIKTLRPYGTWMINLHDKFLTITAFTYSLNLFLAALTMVLRKKLLKDSRYRSLSLIFAFMLGTLFFHAITGVALVATIIISGVLILLLGSRFFGETFNEIHRYILPVIALLAALVFLPYLLSLGGVSGGEEGSILSKHLHISIRSILSIIIPLGILFFPARSAFRKLIREGGARSGVLIFWSFSLVIICIFVNLPTVNESKFIFPLFLLIGPPIYIEIVEKIRQSTGLKRGLIIFAVIALFMVPPVLTFRGFIIQKPGNDITERRYNVSPEDKSFYNWIRSNTPDDAIIIENNIYHLAPVYGDRRNLYSWQGVIRVLGYSGEKMELYGDIQESLFSSGDIPMDTIRDMRRVDHPLYVAVWREDLESIPGLSGALKRSDFFSRVYNSERVSLYAFNGNEIKQ